MEDWQEEKDHKWFILLYSSYPRRNGSFEMNLTKEAFNDAFKEFLAHGGKCDKEDNTNIISSVHTKPTMNLLV